MTRSDRLRPLLLTFVKPGAALQGALAETSPTLAISVSGAAFGLLFLQTGLDLARAGLPTLPLLGWSGAAGVAALTILGVLYGTLGIWLLVEAEERRLEERRRPREARHEGDVA